MRTVDTSDETKHHEHVDHRAQGSLPHDSKPNRRNTVSPNNNHRITLIMLVLPPEKVIATAKCRYSRQ